MTPDEERAKIKAEQPACITAEDMTGALCACAYACRNYWLRATRLQTRTPMAGLPAETETP